MVRILLETSLPFETIHPVQRQLTSGTLGAGFSADLRLFSTTGGCQQPAAGGGPRWTPCWITLEAERFDPVELGPALTALKAIVAEASRRGGMEVFCVPATAQIGDEYRRFRDLLDVLGLAGDG